MHQIIKDAAELLLNSRYCFAFTGAGISVESGVPPFRGPNSIWEKYDPKVLALDYFFDHPKECWEAIYEIFYLHFAEAKPNLAHIGLAQLESQGILRAVITQNIDNLHHAAGTHNIVEFHGNSRNCICVDCGKHWHASSINFEMLPPLCSCGGLLKPDFVFFDETIPTKTLRAAEEIIHESDVVLVIGTTGEVYPAAQIPFEAAYHGATIIEINPELSAFSKRITKYHIRTKAEQGVSLLLDKIKKMKYDID